MVCILSKDTLMPPAGRPLEMISLRSGGDVRKGVWPGTAVGLYVFVFFFNYFIFGCAGSSSLHVGLSLVLGLLIVVASLIVKHRL